MQFFQPVLWYSAIPVLWKTFHHCNNFLLGERWVGEENIHLIWGDEWFDKEKQKMSHWCEWKETLLENRSFVTSNEVPLCSSWLYNGQEKMDRLIQHSSSAWSSLQCPQLQCSRLPRVLRPRQQDRHSFCKGYWKVLTGSPCWTIQSHANETFIKENTPQAIALVLGAPRLGDGSSAKVPACMLQEVHNAGEDKCLKVPFIIKETKGSKAHPQFQKTLWSDDFSWICTSTDSSFASWDDGYLQKDCNKHGRWKEKEAQNTHVL